MMLRYYIFFGVGTCISTYALNKEHAIQKGLMEAHLAGQELEYKDIISVEIDY